MGVVLMPDLYLGGVQGPEGPRLGVRRPDPRPADGQVESLEMTLAEMQGRLSEAQATVDLLREDAAVLWLSLKVAVGWIREERLEHGQEDLPEDLLPVARVLLERNYGDDDEILAEAEARANLQHDPPTEENFAAAEAEVRAERTCPECRDGKHPNCTEEVPVEDDEGKGRMVACGCKEAGHAA